MAGKKDIVGATSAPMIGLWGAVLSWLLMLVFAIAWQQRVRSNPAVGIAGAMGMLWWLLARALCFTIKDNKCRGAIAASLLCDIALFVYLDDGGQFHDPGSLLLISVAMLLWLVFLKRLSTLIGESMVEKRSFRSLILVAGCLLALLLSQIFPGQIALWYGFLCLFVFAAVSSVFLTIHSAISLGAGRRAEK